jgi:hypothetical protein
MSSTARIKGVGFAVLAGLVAASALFACSYRNMGTGYVDEGGTDPTGIFTTPTSTGDPTSTGTTTGAPTGSGTATSTATGTPGCPAASVQSSQIPPFKDPLRQLGACTPQELSTFSAAAKKTGATYVDLFNSVSAMCSSCIFSTESDTYWQPIVWSPNMSAGTAFTNYGACYAGANAGNTSCGKGVQDFDTCELLACPTMCTDQTGCQSLARTGACQTYVTAYTSGCGSNLTSLNTTCGTFDAMLKVVCGTGG